MQKILAAALVGAFAFVGYQRPAECHGNHCHGETIQICGSGSKRYVEPRTFVGPVGGTTSAELACAEAGDELEENLEVEAHSRCPELHQCATCPSSCGGCKNENATGEMTKKKTATAKKRADGSFTCTIEADVAFQCSCSPCTKNGS